MATSIRDHLPSALGGVKRNRVVAWWFGIASGLVALTVGGVVVGASASAEDQGPVINGPVNIGQTPPGTPPSTQPPVSQSGDLSPIVTFGNEPGRRQDHAMPDVDYAGATRISVQGDLRAWGGVFGLTPSDTTAFKFVGGRGLRGAGGQAMVESAYRSESGKSLSIVSWTPTHQVEVSLPVGSPVHRAEEKTIAGRQVIIITPTDNVVERRGLYRAYIVGPRMIQLIDGEGFAAGDDFVGMVTRMAAQGELR